MLAGLDVHEGRRWFQPTTPGSGTRVRSSHSNNCRPVCSEPIEAVGGPGRLGTDRLGIGDLHVHLGGPFELQEKSDRRVHRTPTVSGRDCAG